MGPSEGEIGVVCLRVRVWGGIIGLGCLQFRGPDYSDAYGEFPRSGGPPSWKVSLRMRRISISSVYIQGGALSLL